ncbi:MAG: insulinase family protein [Thermoleophilia bacterium]|nr:insulinase family protein [Thermoleophilia bacterium]
MTGDRALDTTREGLRIISEPLAGVRSVALGFWIGVGSRFERASEGGISHFIEHLLFKGTDRYSAAQIAELFDGLGGEINAATGRDHTVVYTRVLDEHLEVAFEVIADMLTRPAFREVEQERQVILEEIVMYEDDPGDLVNDLISEAVFPDQPLGRPVIGTREVIASVPDDDLRAFHRGHYTAGNIVVAASGSIDQGRLVELSERYLGGLGETTETHEVVPGAPGAPTIVSRVKPTEQYHLALGGPGLDRSDDRRHAMGVLDVILGGSMSSRLFQEIREKRGLAYSVGTYSVGYADTGQVGVYLGTREDNLAEAAEIVGREMSRMGSEPVPAEELSRAREHLKGRLVLGLESPATRMHRNGRAVLSGTELLEVDEIMERIEAVTADDVGAVAREFWNPSRMSVAAIGPNDDVVRTAAGRLAPQGVEA